MFYEASCRCALVCECSSRQYSLGASRHRRRDEKTQESGESVLTVKSSINCQREILLFLYPTMMAAISKSKPPCESLRT
ncbi:hypothetical protein E2C01_063193 [Portunus trituberculatus]|uniref:Uncharacterized protein n=1 Tax=Portunus trituberculatus TaxID=210409 RepID=A0A5B7H9U4_PORTR|nr:hypothetical protein [Portunus trituberculatus]